MGYVRPKRAKRPANRPKWPSHSLRRRVWTTRFFKIHDPGAFDEHFFNGLLKAKMAGDRGHCLVITTVSDGASRGAEKRKMHPKAYWSNEIP